MRPVGRMLPFSGETGTGELYPMPLLMTGGHAAVPAVARYRPFAVPGAGLPGAAMAADPTVAALTVAVAAKVPVLLWGAPGTGKTSAIRALADAAGLPCETVIASIREPSGARPWPVTSCCPPCDTAVAPAQRVPSARQVQLIGGGGTDMGAGIAAAAVLRPRPTITVVLTDGYTPWPGVAPKGTRVVVALIGGAAPAAPVWAHAVRVPTASA